MKRWLLFIVHVYVTHDNPTLLYVSESDILGPIDLLSDIETLVSFERATFEEYIFIYKMKIFLSFMSLPPL